MSLKCGSLVLKAAAQPTLPQLPSKLIKNRNCQVMNPLHWALDEIELI